MEKDVMLECDSCHFQTTKLTEYERSPFNRNPSDPTTKKLCDLCASTVAGNTVDYPASYRDPAVLRTICYVGNVILQAIQLKQGRIEVRNMDLQSIARDVIGPSGDAK
jgi:hypothetical protein